MPGISRAINHLFRKTDRFSHHKAALNEIEQKWKAILEEVIESDLDEEARVAKIGRDVLSGVRKIGRSK